MLHNVPKRYQICDRAPRDGSRRSAWRLLQPVTTNSCYVTRRSTGAQKYVDAYIRTCRGLKLAPTGVRCHFAYHKINRIDELSRKIFAHQNSKRDRRGSPDTHINNITSA